MNEFERSRVERAAAIELIQGFGGGEAEPAVRELHHDSIGRFRGTEQHVNPDGYFTSDHPDLSSSAADRTSDDRDHRVFGEVKIIDLVAGLKKYFAELCVVVPKVRG